MSNPDKKQLSREPYKGVRDFYPEDWAFQKSLFEKMRKVVESYGYVEYQASPLEPAELYVSKTNEEIVNEQTYTFTDRGDRKVTLRPEMTPTLVRMIAARRRELAFPLRWYSIPNLFRYESPQRGRLREHYQLNIDLFGLSGLEADQEIITIAYQIMRALGAKDEDFEIRINSRKALQQFLKSTITDENDMQKAMRLLDKKDKMAEGDFKSEWAKLSNNAWEKNIEISPTINTLIKNLENNGVKNVIYSESLVRGFDYYTDIVFEIFDKSEENRRALFGGGRYDELLSIFDEESIPAVGFGMGDVAVRDFLMTHNLLPAYDSPINIYICVLGEDNKEVTEFVEKTANTLRLGNLNVAIDWSHRKVGDQIKAADKQKIPYVIVIGEEEVKNNNLKLKNLKSGEELVMTTEEIIAKLS